MRLSRIVRRALGLGMVCAVVPALAAAQAPAPPPAAPPDVRFFSAYAFHLDAAHLASDDARYVWDANFGGAIDLADYRTGRLQFVANYNVGLGEQVRRFDPNQGNYQLDLSASYRLGPNEIAGVFHHLSRHLSDRPKIPSIDWNMGGVRWSRADRVGTIQVQATAQLLGAIKTTFVDYTWEGTGRVAFSAPLRPAVAVIASGDLRVVGVDPLVAGRDRQTGWRTEGGVRLTGTGAAVELFAAAEQRIDPYPLDRTTVRWAMAGFRFVSK